MTGYITVSMGNQAHAHTQKHTRAHTHTKQAKCTHTKRKMQATFGHVLGIEPTSCTVQTQRESVCLCLHVSLTLTLTHTHTHTHSYSKRNLERCLLRPC